MKKFVVLEKLQKGDQVGVISPSTGLPGLFPWVQDLGLERLRDVFGLVPKEYPTTRQMGSSLEDRARDIMAAFSDPKNKAVIASIGGHDQIKLIKLLDDKIFLANPKPFFGYSDNTHLVNYLWNLGIPSYYGGAIMTQFAFQNQLPEITETGLNRALFESGEFELPVAKQYNDIGLQWSDPTTLNEKRVFETNDGWFWDGSADASGVLWGGCMESLSEELLVGTYLPADEDLTGVVLFLESSEQMPPAWAVDYLLTAMGERGWFDRFQAILVGRPKAWHFGNQLTVEQKKAYAAEQRETVLKTIRSYSQTIPIVQNLDFGHTDPQVPLPSGGNVRVVPSAKKIFLTY